MLFVSIIIPAWNEARSLKASFEALSGVDYERDKIELIIVAGGEDNTYEIATQLTEATDLFARRVVLPQGRKRTKNAAIQQGIREANNPVIVLLDADTIVSAQWLRSLVAPIESGDCDMTIANSEPVNRNWVADYFMIVKTYFLEEITTYPGHSIAFKADMVKSRINYFFDVDTWMGDDYVLESRAIKAGKRVTFVKEATVKTHFPCSLRYFMKIEAKWLTAYIEMNGVSWGTLIKSSLLIGSLICLFPFSSCLFLGSLLVQSCYVTKRTFIFLSAARVYRTRLCRLFGFVFLSYIYHTLQLVAYARYFLGLSADTYYQGQRY